MTTRALVTLRALRTIDYFSCVCKRRAKWIPCALLFAGWQFVIVVREHGIEIRLRPILGGGIVRDEQFRERPPPGSRFAILGQRELPRLLRVMVKPPLDDMEFIDIVLRDDGMAPSLTLPRRAGEGTAPPSSSRSSSLFCTSLSRLRGRGGGGGRLPPLADRQRLAILRRKRPAHSALSAAARPSDHGQSASFGTIPAPPMAARGRDCPDSTCLASV